MEIKKGDWFRCIESPNKKDIAMGDYYQSETYDILKFHTDPKNSHVFHDDGWERFFVKLYTIKDLKDGKVAVVNDGTVEDIVKVMKCVFNVKVNGNAKYYYENNGWDAGGKTGLPTQSVKDFLVQFPNEVIIEYHDTLNTRREKLGYKPVVNTPINPKHYSFNIKGTPCDLFDIGNAMDLNKEQFTALRYFRKKENQIEDTKKAIKCLERLVERLESERND